MQDVPLEQRGTSDTLSDLATEIITVTKTLTDLLKSGGLPEPGLSDATKASLSSNKEIIEVRKALKEAANALRVVSYSDPYEHVQELVCGHTFQHWIPLLALG
ncbi:hypothetical protein BJ508DRAFT_122063 [Ascobolus immersus RN42]|uniref:Uncharacterized protein n=1 Tax=Ascobolus immersus RN42 TaxID=1160509 RepID=A0A3N4ILA8_ASCIM|nr:hypothetical protein BJ508DRAFT_122063 [Ascobolus immersus RN42]